MKNLFSKSLSPKKLVLVFTSFLVFAASLGFFFYEGTKKTVAISLDGQEKVIKTHADTIQDIFDDLDIPLHSKDYVFPSKDSRVKNNTQIEWKPAKQVQIVTDNEKKTIYTTASTVAALLKEQKIVLNQHDQIQPTPQTALKQDMSVKIVKAFPVILADGGKRKQVWSTSATVADFLKQQGIALKKSDRVDPALNTTVKKNGLINVIRVEKVTDVVEEPVEFAVVTKKDSKLAKGTKKVVREGKKGKVAKQFAVTKENGKVISRKLISIRKIAEKQDKLIAMGTKVSSKQVSRGENESGREMYVTSTAYTANCSGCSGTTKTGVNLHSNPNAKVIAVDPKVIPLGTKVYVEGYGYAIAADTGSAIKGNKIDVFFPSTSDAYRWGRKTVKIKILD